MDALACDSVANEMRGRVEVRAVMFGNGQPVHEHAILLDRQQRGDFHVEPKVVWEIRLQHVRAVDDLLKMHGSVDKWRTGIPWFRP